jgi:hypothetical protein
MLSMVAEAVANRCSKACRDRDRLHRDASGMSVEASLAEKLASFPQLLCRARK